MGNELVENIVGKTENDLKEHSRAYNRGLFGKQGICEKIFW